MLSFYSQSNLIFTHRISESGNAIASVRRSVCPSVLSPILLSNRVIRPLTFYLLHVYGSWPQLCWNWRSKSKLRGRQPRSKVGILAVVARPPNVGNSSLSLSVNVCRAAEQLDELEYEGSSLKVSSNHAFCRAVMPTVLPLFLLFYTFMFLLLLSKV